VRRHRAVAGGGEFRIGEGGGADDFRDPEIEQFHHAAGGDLDVGRLEVTMDHEILMQVVNRRADLLE
jgi:hypothetical protein